MSACSSTGGSQCRLPAWAEGYGNGETPILSKVGTLAKDYKVWVHRPAGGRPRFFQSAILEGITKTPWWVVPLLWIPFLVYCSYVSLSPEGQVAQNAGLVALGFLTWQLLEYCIHRYAFHTIPEGYWGITAHFLFHGCHHKYPLDATRLVFPPIPAAGVAVLITATLRQLVEPKAVTPIFTGVGYGYLLYDCMHYSFHHGTRVQFPGYAALRRAHLRHHYRSPEAGFGISSPMLDVLLRSFPASEGQKAKSCLLTE